MGRGRGPYLDVVLVGDCQARVNGCGGSPPVLVQLQPYGPCLNHVCQALGKGCVALHTCAGSHRGAAHAEAYLSRRLCCLLGLPLGLGGRACQDGGGPALVPSP